MEIEALGAAHGDAIVVRWQDGAGATRLGLVDGGPAKAYQTQLQPNLDSLAAEHGGGPVPLEFVCVSHIDDDHIGGIERLFTAIRRQKTAGQTMPAAVKRLWFNSWERLGMNEKAVAAASAAPVVGASVRQGRDLRDIARLLRIDGNAPVQQGFLAGVGFDLDGLRVDVVTPGPNELDRLFQVWERSEKEPEVFTSAYKDRSVPNLSSIALLVRGGGRIVLLTGDARGDHVLAGLQAGGFLSRGRLHVDVLKLPHHGSINNVAAGFFEAISADRYIVSADGVTHGLPNPDCLDLLLASRAAGDEFEIMLTNEMPSIEQHLANQQGNRPFKIVTRPAELRGLVA
jgi:beta-lactamase superfamily II metal-dependent hydrolase